MSDNPNPRGERRPRDGRGKSLGMKGGRRIGKNPNPCGPKRGYGKGEKESKRILDYHFTFVCLSTRVS